MIWLLALVLGWLGCAAAVDTVSAALTPIATAAGRRVFGHARPMVMGAMRWWTAVPTLISLVRCPSGRRDFDRCFEGVPSPQQYDEAVVKATDIYLSHG